MNLPSFKFSGKHTFIFFSHHSLVKEECFIPFLSNSKLKFKRP